MFPPAPSYPRLAWQASAKAPGGERAGQIIIPAKRRMVIDNDLRFEQRVSCGQVARFQGVNLASGAQARVGGGFKARMASLPAKLLPMLRMPSNRLTSGEKTLLIGIAVGVLLAIVLARRCRCGHRVIECRWPPQPAPSHQTGSGQRRTDVRCPANLGRYFSLAIVAVAVFAWTACAHRGLRPAPMANAVAPDTAIASQEGVSVRAEAGAWSGRPEDLKEQYTPMKVTIRNHGSKPVAVRYREFVMAGSNGKQYHALPPFRTQGSVTQSPAAPVALIYPYTGFGFAPYYAGYFPAATLFTGPFIWDAPYYSTYFPTWQVNLPTPDMINRALPEGVLQPGGAITGFLYFQKIPADLKGVRFQAHLKVPNSSMTVASLGIPCHVK